ncbi:MAG: (2Fe-2S)-binding protein [Dehalococcoidia bacterium]|nr:(2Fe-2S)-binding protein [Dehalococcoidia bacterium]
MKIPIMLKVNGEIYDLEINPWKTLLEVLREDLNLTGTKRGCDTGDCGTCTVIMDGKSILSCLLLAMEARGKDITTIEGLAREGRLDPVQETFISHGAIQCGFCTPGMILTAKAFLAENRKPTREEIKFGISGNICRCTGYAKIIEAIEAAAGVESK